MFALCVALMLPTAPVDLPKPGEPVSKSRFLEVMRELHSRHESISYLYEGEQVDFDDAGAPVVGGDPKRIFGSFSLRGRSRPAGRLETYLTNPASHHSYCTLDGRIDANAGLGEVDPETKSWVLPRGDIFFLPWRHDYTSYFRGIRDGGEFFYEDLGWEEVDSVPCLKVRLDSVPGKAAPRRPQIVWFDFTRGGHAVRIQDHHRGILMTATRIKKLSKFTSKSTEIWLPTTVVIDSFASFKGPARETPLSRTEFRVVADTVEVDPTLPDSEFRAHAKSSGKNGVRLKMMLDAYDATLDR